MLFRKYGKVYIEDACRYYLKAYEEGINPELTLAKLKELHQNHIEACFRALGKFSSDNEQLGDFCIDNDFVPLCKQAIYYYKLKLNHILEKIAEAEKLEKEMEKPVERSANGSNTAMFRDLDLYKRYVYQFKKDLEKHGIIGISSKPDSRDVARLENKINNCYEQYFSQEADPEQATIYKKALQGDAIAQYELGKLFYDKNFNLFDYSEAAHWFELSAEKGYAGAQTQLAYCYMMAFGVEKNEAEAFRWSQLAAQQGNATGQCYLAWCYENAFGVQRNYQEAFKWYKTSAEHGNTASQYHLGLCYENGYGTEKSLLQAASWISKSASKLYLLAQARMGVYYAKGLGVPKSLQEAVKYYKLAAEQGHAISQYNLGVCYCNGEGVTQNYAEAIKWYTLAAEQNCAVAQNNLASCYFYGYGVNANLYKAKELYERSAKNGYKKATANLQTCKEKMAN